MEELIAAWLPKAIFKLTIYLHVSESHALFEAISYLEDFAALGLLFRDASSLALCLRNYNSNFSR